MNTHKNSTTIGQYLLERLHAYGVRHIFGVPGDYVLRSNKLIEQHSEIQFINTIRENTAGYAADAYARMLGLGVACVTYGVGVGITDALVQAYLESSPVVIISGTAGVGEYKKHSVLHHLINQVVSEEGDCTQLEIFKKITVDQGILTSPETAIEIIDRVLHACVQHKKPVYLEIPRDQVEQPIPSLAVSYSFPFLSSKAEVLQEVLTKTQDLLSTSRQLVIWAGHEILRFGLSQELLQFAEKHHIPIVSTLLGKTVIDEHHPLFVGVYQGKMSPVQVSEFMDKCDCLLIAGVILHDLDTGLFTANLEDKSCIEVNAHSVKIDHQCYQDIELADYMKGLNTLILPQMPGASHLSRHSSLPNKFEAAAEAKTTTKRVFECLQSYLSPEHVIVSDVGDSLFASSDLVLEYNSFIASAYFANLGFGTPAAIGAQFACPQRRVIALIGDGGFQMTGMELSTAVHYHVDPIIIILNNHGYGTERILLEGSYNDLVDWDYTKIPQVLRGGIGIKVETEKAFEEALKEALAHRGVFYLIDVELEKLDFSPSLNRLGEVLGKVVRS